MEYLDLMELDRELDDLKARRGMCAHCGEPVVRVHTDPSGVDPNEGWDDVVHEDGMRDLCDPEDPYAKAEEDLYYNDEEDRFIALSDLDDELNTLWSVARDNSSAIPECEWVEYAEQLADDLGMVDSDSSLRFYIDWEKWAEDLKMDYSSFDFEGTTYYVRSY